MPAARIDALKVSVRNLEGGKLQWRSKAAKRAQRKDELTTLSVRRRGGVVEAKRRQLCVRSLGDDLQAGCPQPGDGVHRDAPFAEPLVGRPRPTETSDREEQEGGELTVVARRLALDGGGENLRGHLRRSLLCRRNRNAESAAGVTLLNGRAGGMRVVHGHDQKLRRWREEQSRSHAGTSSNSHGCC